MNNVRLIDTNLIIRFLVNDDPQKADRVEKILKDKESKNILLDTVVAEIIWVLTSYYELDKKTTIEKIEALIHLESIKCNSQLLGKSLTIWRDHPISFIDAYIIAVAEEVGADIYSYDRKFDKVKSIKRREP